MSLKLAYDTSQNFCYLDYFLQIRANKEYELTTRSSLPVICWRKRGFLKVLKDSKLISNKSEGLFWLFRKKLVSFRIFLKQMIGRELLFEITVLLSGSAKHYLTHGLRTPREKIAFTARPKIHSHSQIVWYGGSIFCLPHRPNFSDIFDLCLHWVSVVRG